MMETEKRGCGLSGLTGGFLIFLLCILALIRDPHALDSGLVYRLLVLNVVLLFALLAFLFTPLRRKLNWAALENRVVLAYGAYVVAVWLSLLVALNPSAGLLDACRSGAVLIVHCLCLVLFASSPEWRQWLARSATLAALACGMVGLYQCYECAVWNAPTRRWLQGITGLMGNVNLFAGYLLMLLPFCIVGVVLLRGFWRFAAALAAMNSLFLIVLLQGRSVWVGAAAVIAVFALAIFIRPQLFGFGIKTRFLIVAAVAFSAVALTLFLKFSPSENPIASRMRAVLSEDVRIADGGRLMIWRETLRMFSDNFPFGVGAGNFTIHLQGYREGGRLDFLQIDSRWNQPHNDYIWILAEKGIFGFLAFLFALILAAFSGVCSIAGSRSREESWMATAALAALAAYVVDSFFSFPLDRVNHQAALGVILAALAIRPADHPPGVISRRNFRIPIFAALAFGLLGIGITIASVSLKQEHHVALAREAMSRGHWNTMQKQAQLARTSLRTLDTYAVPVSFLEGFALMKKGSIDEALPLFELADRENPIRFYILNNLAVMYLARGMDQKAGELFQRLHRLYPEEPEATCNLALFLLNHGQTDQALKLIENFPREKIPPSILQRFSIPSAGKPD
jgi:O-antigen ligase